MPGPWLSLTGRGRPLPSSKCSPSVREGGPEITFSSLVPLLLSFGHPDVTSLSPVRPLEGSQEEAATGSCLPLAMGPHILGMTRNNWIWGLCAPSPQLLGDRMQGEASLSGPKLGPDRVKGTCSDSGCPSSLALLSHGALYPTGSKTQGELRLFK